MDGDFTYDKYADLVSAGIESGYEFLTLREYFTEESLPERFIVLRHDVDRKPRNALDFARIEARRGISSTYYFRTIDKTFEPSLISEIEELGHEIGYHYEDMDRADGNIEAAHESFETHLATLREHASVRTICMHGNPLTSHDNRDMWTGDVDLESYNVVGEAYLMMDFTDVMYYTDTGRTWRDGALKIKDHTVGEDDKTIQVDTTDELIELLRNCREDRLCLLSHPNRWAGDEVERVKELTKDTATNVAKYVIQAAHRF